MATKRRHSHSDTSVQVLSDLHLETAQEYYTRDFPATAPFLVLAGDIGRLANYVPYQVFLTRQAARFQRVFLVLGNHEFYGMSYAEGIDTARRMVGELGGRVVLLHQSRWDDPDSALTLLGCTLWARRELVLGSNVLAGSDFMLIKGWSVDMQNAVNAQEAAWLLDQVGGLFAAGPPSRQVLIVTHHAPELTNSAADGSQWDGMSTWVFGMATQAVDAVVRSIRLVSNSRGFVFAGRARLDAPKSRKTAHAPAMGDGVMTLPM